MNGERPKSARGGIRPWVWAAAALFVVSLLPLPVASSADKADDKVTVQDLPEYWRLWITEEVYPLISKNQKRAFLELETDAQRQAFAERLWILWGRESGYGSQFRSIYDERLNFCRVEFGNTTVDLARVLLIHGPPAMRFKSRCPEFFVPLEIWAWPYIENLGENVVTLFYQSAGFGRYRMWYGVQGRRALANVMRDASAGTPLNTGSRFDGPAYRCPEGDTLMRLIATAEMWSRDPNYLRMMTQFMINEDKEAEGASRRFMAFSALLEKDAEPLEFEVKDESWGMRGGLVQVAFNVDVAIGNLGTTPVGDVDVYQLDVIGEITSRTKMVDRFRYMYSVPSAKQQLSLIFERFIRPGDYELRLKVEDVHSPRESIAEYGFTASSEPTGEPPAAQLAALGGFVTADLDVEFEADEPVERPLLDLVGPEGEAISGLRRFEAVTREEVARVTFLVNEDHVLTKNRAPFDVDLDLGPLPRLTTVTAIGYDRSGEEIARERMSLNVGKERFYLRIKPLSPADTVDGRTKVKVDVNIPTNMEFEKLELFWNEQRLSTMTGAPFEEWVTLEGGADFGYLRAVASMTDGSKAEDLQFVNAPEFGTVIDVTAVELPVTVLDRDGRPVENLQQGDFRILEDGVLQEISHFSLHRDLPVRLGIVIDTSGSMETSLPTVQKVVMGFLRDLLRPRDRAFIEVFSDQPDVLAAFTADFEVLENALLALFADRATALYDSIIMGLFQFSGAQGRKAMVVVTDGEDTASDHDFDDVVRFAQRAGVTIYTIGIDLPATKVVSRWQLGKVADTTGGRAFFVSRKSDLEPIYSEIDTELRTQYLLAFTSNSDKPSDELRKIKVEVDRKKVKVRTISGYYPGGI